MGKLKMDKFGLQFKDITRMNNSVFWLEYMYRCSFSKNHSK